MKSAKLLKIGIPLLLVAASIAGSAYYLSSNPAQSATENEEQGGFYGVIVDGENNTPLMGATVIAHHTDDPHFPDMVCISDKTGRIGFELEDGKYLITASSEGYTTRGRNDTGRLIEVVNHTNFVNAKLKLWPVASIQGRVTAGNTGIQANISISYDRDASGAEQYEFQQLTADESGSFAITNAYAGFATVSISADGFASIDLRDIIIKAGQNIDLGDIPLRDGVSIFGQITDEANHRGIRGAQIIIKNTSNDTIGQATTDSNGNYRLPALDMMQISFDISAEGYYPFKQNMMLKGNANREFNLKLHRAWGLSLNVQNQTERSPEKTIIKITDVSSGKVVYEESLANGTYSLDTLKGGPFLIEAESADHLTKTSTRASTGDSVYLRLKPFGKIVVRAFNSDGTKLTEGEYHYYYRAEQTETSTENSWSAIASSEFEIADLPEGYYRVEIRKDKEKSISSHEFRLLNGDVRNLDMQLTEGGVLIGHVVTTEGNAVRANVTLTNDSRNIQTDRDGYFTFDKMPNSATTLVVKPNRTEEETTFENIVVQENGKLERDFVIHAPDIDRRAERRTRFHEMRERGEIPPPPWGDGKPPWGDGKPPWGDGQPPWGDGLPPWGNGQPPQNNGQHSNTDNPPAPPTRPTNTR